MSFDTVQKHQSVRISCIYLPVCFGLLVCCCLTLGSPLGKAVLQACAREHRRQLREYAMVLLKGQLPCRAAAEEQGEDSCSSGASSRRLCHSCACAS